MSTQSKDLVEICLVLDVDFLGINDIGYLFNDIHFNRQPINMSINVELQQWILETRNANKSQ